jgi:hypothetical protein
MRHVLYLVGLSLGIVTLGCSSSAADTTVIVRPELVAVSPDDFLRGLACGSGADDVQSYVATLFDISPEADGSVPSPGFQLASSPPTSCLLPVTFSFVLTTHRYLAEIDAYDRAPQTSADASVTAGIAPSAPGGRLQFDEKGALVKPRWTFTCGGYPATPGDGGSYGGAGSLGEVVPGDGGAAGEGTVDFPPGILTYDGLTQTTHNCQVGLPPASN